MALGDVIARLSVVLGLDTATFEGGASATERRAAQLQKSLEATGASMVNLGAKLSIAVTAPLIALGKTSIDAAIQSRDGLAQVKAGIASMGNAAGRTAEQLQDLASRIQDTSKFDDDDVLRKVSATLLTFGNISGTVFDRAEQGAVDLSAKLGQDLQSSAIQLGKALNDPIKGITALQRVGVSFTDQQKEQIKTMVEAGNVAGAQGVILTEVAREFGGAAKAARDADPFAGVAQQLRTFSEVVGGQLLNILPNVLKAVENVISAFNSLSPGVQQGIVYAGLFAAALGPLTAAFGAVTLATAPFRAALLAISGEGGALLATRSGIIALIGSFNPLTVALTAVVGTFGYLAYRAYASRDATEAHTKALAESQKVADTVAQLTMKLASAHGEERKQVLAAAIAYQKLIEQQLASAKASVLQSQAKLAQARLAQADQVQGGSFASGVNPEGGMTALWAGMGDANGRVNQAKANLATDALVLARSAQSLAQVSKSISSAEKPIVNVSAGFDKIGSSGGAAAAGIDRASAAARSAADDFKALWDDLYPADAAAVKFGKDAELLRAGAAAHGKSAEQINEAIGLLSQQSRPALGDIDILSPNFDFTEVEKQVAAFQVKAKVSAETVQDSFASMAQGVVNSLDRMAQAVKGGGFLDILSSVLGLGLQLAGIGAFGSKVQANVKASKVPGFATGTNNAPAGLALVGERGPELVQFRGGERVVPNNALGGSSRTSVTNIYTLPSDEFWGKVNAGHAAAAQTGADLAIKRISWRQTRRVG